ncbi:MAG: hypothetical protein ACR2K3_11020 [Nocardioides sp.]
MSRRRWVGRVVVGALLYAAIYAGALVEHVRPDAVRLALLVGVGVAVIGLVLDTAAIGAAGWEVVDAFPVTPPGQDHGLSTYVRLVENHLTSRTPDPLLQQRLERLVDLRLERRSLRRGDPGVDDLLGPAVLRVIDGPTRRLTPAELTQCVRHIEEL